MHKTKPTSYRQSGATRHKLKKQSLLLTIKTTENFKEILHCSTKRGKRERTLNLFVLKIIAESSSVQCIFKYIIPTS